MLVSLAIRNFVLIEDDTLEFGPGLTALTGETGAGKTLLTQALELLLGERAGEGLIGPAAEDATIQGVFLLSADSLSAIPEDVRDLAALEPGELVATRRLQATGRNRAFLNGTAVTLGVLAQALEGLVAFSGQHEHRRLVEPSYQRTVLDAFAGEQSAVLLRDYEEAWAEARRAEALLREGELSAEERRRERELLAFQVDELEAAELSLGEEDDLERRQQLLSRAEEVARATADAAELARSEGDRPDAAGLLSSARARLSGVAGLVPQVDEALASLEEAQMLVDDAARELRRAADQVEVDPAGAAQVGERLRVYLDLGRKYGGSTAAAVAFLEEGRARLAVLDAVEEDLAGARAQQERAVERALKLAAELTALRGSGRSPAGAGDRTRAGGSGHDRHPRRRGAGVRRRVARSGPRGGGYRRVPAGTQPGLALAPSGPHRVGRRAVAQSAGHQGGAGRAGGSRDAGLRRGGRRHRRADGYRGGAETAPALGGEPGPGNHPPAAGGGIR